MRRSPFGAPGGSFGFSLDVTPVVRKLLIANFAVWGVQVVLGLAGTTFFTDFFSLDPERTLPWRPWQVVTYMFLHSAPGPHVTWNLWHIVFNMLILAFMGGPVERRLGGPGFMRFYLLCGVAGGVLTLLPPFRAPTVGASGAVFGVLTAFGLLYPNRPIYILLLFPVPAKYVVVGLAFIQLLSAAGSANDGVAYITHIGGMAAGYLLLRGVPFASRLQRRWAREQQQRSAVQRAQRQRDIDAILDKMNEEGDDGLTQEEWKALLDEARRRRDGT